MMSQQKYSYVVLRYVHDVVTGEFINAGVLMHFQETGTVKIKVRSSVGRIKHAFPDLDRNAFLTAVRGTERAARKLATSLKSGDLFSEDDNASSLAHRIFAEDDSSQQWSPMAGGITDDPDKAFERVFRRFVSKYDMKAQHRRSDDDVWRPVRQMLDDRNVPVQFDEKTIVGTTDEIVFKHAWKNGAWHAYEAISFDLADADGIKDKARRWRGHLEAVSDGAEPDLKLYLVVGAPANNSLNPAYQNAIKILGDSAFSPEIYEETEISSLVTRIEDEVRSHSDHG